MIILKLTKKYFVLFYKAFLIPQILVYLHVYLARVWVTLQNETPSKEQKRQ